MVESPAIAALESTAADLGKLLSGWTSDRLAESEAAHANPADPTAAAAKPDLTTINAGIQSLWRLVSVQKSILQLKNPPSSPAPDRPKPEFRFGVQTSVCPATSHVFASQSTSPVTSPEPMTNVAPAPSPAIQSSAATIPFSVPQVPSVPVAPAYRSIETIAAKTERLYAQTAALLSATNPTPKPGNADLPIGKTSRSKVPPPLTPKTTPALPDQLKIKLLDAITGRPVFPGSGNLLNSFLTELATSPP
ncbi:hypothetical protein LLG95_17275 [bacterium]|nr:hypothetical protein [bacterium]